MLSESEREDPCGGGWHLGEGRITPEARWKSSCTEAVGMVEVQKRLSTTLFRIVSMFFGQTTWN